MKESAQVAYSFAKGVMAREFPKNRFFEHAKIHLHCPEGATPKDGPSAGITMATSMLSLALDKQIQTTVAMTGELTVTGKVLRIGGLREKTVAARRAGATMVIFPEENMADWLELPEVRSPKQPYIDLQKLTLSLEYQRRHRRQACFLVQGGV
jgi:Lon-like ATP-dependent protease